MYLDACNADHSGGAVWEEPAASAFTVEPEDVTLKFEPVSSPKLLYHPKHITSLQRRS
jgi:hypothetical protein